MSNQYERLDAPDPVDQAAELAQMQLNIALQNQKNSRRTLLPKLAEMKNKKLSPFYILGKKYAADCKFDGEITAQLRKLYRFNSFILIGLKICITLGIFNIHWNRILKKNGSLNKRLAAPYQNRSPEA